MASRLIAPLVLGLALLFAAGCSAAPNATSRNDAPVAQTASGVAPAPTAPAKPAAEAAKAAAPAQPPAVAPGVAGAPAPLLAPTPARPAAAPQPAAAPAPPADAAGRTTTAIDNAVVNQPLPQLPASSDRMIVYTTDITLLVRNIGEAVSTIGDLATSQGGYLAGVENSVENGVPISTLRIKVLPERYQAAMSALRGLAVEVSAEKATTQDVTEEYSDVQTQIASLEATHRQLLDLLAKATTVDEIMKIQTQANQIKLQIDRLKGRATVLERLAGLATITARLQPAEAALGKEYVAVRTQLRQAQSAQAAQLLALQRAKTPEEENAIRDKLGELGLQIDRSTTRLKEIEAKASQASLTLPTPAPEDATAAPAGKDLPEQYIDARIQLRRALARQDDLTRRLKDPGLAPEDRSRLQQELSVAILEVSSGNVKLKSLTDRANQIGVALPTLTPEQEAALAGVSVESTAPDPFRAAAQAWEASITFLRIALTGLVSTVVFLWWAIPLAGLLLVTLARRGTLRRLATRRASSRSVPSPTIPPTAGSGSSA